jgi:hypothetical protein
MKSHALAPDMRTLRLLPLHDEKSPLSLIVWEIAGSRCVHAGITMCQPFGKPPLRTAMSHMHAHMFESYPRQEKINPVISKEGFGLKMQVFGVTGAPQVRVHKEHLGTRRKREERRPGLSLQHHSSFDADPQVFSCHMEPLNALLEDCTLLKQQSRQSTSFREACRELGAVGDEIKLAAKNAAQKVTSEELSIYLSKILSSCHKEVFLAQTLIEVLSLDCGLS